MRRAALGLLVLLAVAAACDRDGRRGAAPDDPLARLCRQLGAPDCTRGAAAVPVDGALRRDGRVYLLEDAELRRSADGVNWETLPRPTDKLVPHWLDDDAWAMGAVAPGPKQPRMFQVWRDGRWVPGAAAYPEGIYAIPDWRRDPDGWRILAESDRGQLFLLRLDPAMNEVTVTALQATTPLVAPPGLPEALIGFTELGDGFVSGFRRDADGVIAEVHVFALGATEPQISTTRFGDRLPGSHRTMVLIRGILLAVDAEQLTACTVTAGCVARDLPAEARAVGLNVEGDHPRIALAIGGDLIVLEARPDDAWVVLGVHPLADETEPEGLFRLDDAWFELR